jgi:hypothetical protein
MTSHTDQYGNGRRSDRDGKKAVKQSERDSSRFQKATAIRRLRSQDRLLIRDYRTF